MKHEINKNLEPFLKNIGIGQPYLKQLCKHKEKGLDLIYCWVKNGYINKKSIFKIVINEYFNKFYSLN